MLAEDLHVLRKDVPTRRHLAAAFWKPQRQSMAIWQLRCESVKVGMMVPLFELGDITCSPNEASHVTDITNLLSHARVFICASGTPHLRFEARKMNRWPGFQRISKTLSKTGVKPKATANS
jgi:hypothetical protein